MAWKSSTGYLQSLMPMACGLKVLEGTEIHVLCVVLCAMKSRSETRFLLYRHVKEHPTMHYYRIPRHTQSTIA